jgi:hypothetical protein
MTNSRGQVVNHKATINNIGPFLIGAGFFAVLLLLGTEGVDYIPGHAIVYVDDAHNYYSPPLLWSDSREFHVATSLEEVRARNFRHVSQDPASDREWDEVAQEFAVVWVANTDKTWTEFRPVSGTCVVPVEKAAIKDSQDEYTPDRQHAKAGGFHGKSSSLIFHLLHLNQSRWNADGTWRW